MSATIFWEKVDPTPSSISVGAPSSFIAAMREADLALPCTLGKDALSVLRGMAAVFAPNPNPYRRIVELIEKHGEVRLWAEY